VIVHGDWLLTPQRVAVHRPSATGVVADLHVGYDAARRRRGEAIPLANLAEELSPLTTAIHNHGVKRVVVAGDLFEERGGTVRAAEVLAWFTAAGVELVVVPGNHDRGLRAEAGLPLAPGGVDVGGWRVLHGDGRWPAGRLMCGHFHPWLRWGPADVPCYLVGERAMVLPPFSADARGVDVVPQQRWAKYRCCAVAEDTVLDMGELKKLQDRRR
jgi:uncharacterized protein